MRESRRNGMKFLRHTVVELLRYPKRKTLRAEPYIHGQAQAKDR